jgi:hypothetical protein
MPENTPYASATYDTRRKRRDRVKTIVTRLSEIREAEQTYLDRVPENLQSSESYEIGECAVDALGEIIDLLSDVY